ncbi:MAG: EAL domain-containing protein [Alphaproteobacteria bacterium]|nr:EAL domain-containing protein [Alphaproteobacteria bacterium]
MILVEQAADSKLLEMVRCLEGQEDACHGIIFNLSKLDDVFRSDYQLRIALNILLDILKKIDGAIFPLAGGDVCCVVSDCEEELLHKAMFQLRYLFAEDSLTYFENGSDNPEFCYFYDLSYQYPLFVSMCHKITVTKAEDVASFQKSNVTVIGKNKDIDPFQALINDLESIDLSRAVSRQPACIISQSGKPSHVFEELSIDIDWVIKLLRRDDQAGDIGYLKSRLTPLLDHYLIRTVLSRSIIYLQHPVSFNLRLTTILGSDFERLQHVILPAKRRSVIIELSLQDLLSDWTVGVEAKKRAQEKGYRTCLDGVDIQSLPFIQPKQLGFDLIKLSATSEQARILLDRNSEALIKAIEECNPNRLIMGHCQNAMMVELGKRYGLRLFQGSYIDYLMTGSLTEKGMLV